MSISTYGQLTALGFARKPYVNTLIANTVESTQTAANLAVAAWTSSMDPAETLPAISQSAHYGTIVAQTIYDTSKDSDGGAWIKRCQDKSWYKETLGGDRWIGQRASNAAAWTAAGSATGAVYQSTADGKFYTPTSSSTQTEVFRGISAEFPAVAWAVAEAGRVVVYDLAAPGVPMWMVFKSGAGKVLSSTGTLSGIASINGHLLVSCVGSAGLAQINFAADYQFLRLNVTSAYNGCNVVNRNLATVDYVSGSTVGVVNQTVNSVAITYLPTSPVDPATGLKVPTIAVATAGGVSVIKDDGSVVSRGYTSNSATSIAITGQRVSVGSISNGGKYGAEYLLSNFTTSTIATIDSTDSQRVASYGPTTIPTTLVGNTFNINGLFVVKDAKSIFGGPSGASILYRNDATPAKGMVAYVTQQYNTGYMPGDIRGAYLSDVTAETVTGSGELVTNGTFADASNLTLSGATVAGGTLNFASASIDTATFTGGTALVAGKTYVAVFSIATSTASFGVRLLVNSVLISADIYYTTAGTYTVTFVSPSTGNFGMARATVAHTGTVSIDNISVKLAEPDRSVKNKGMVINGSLVKTSLGTAGSSLVAYSGFSAANYLEQPFSSDLDFGTGNFCVMGWAVPDASGTDYMLERCPVGDTTTPRIECYSISNVPGLYLKGASSVVTVTSTFTATSGVPYFYCAGLRSGTAFISINGGTEVTASASGIGTLTNTAAVTRLGLRPSTSASPWGGSLALWRISATAPSADQIAQIYRDELPLLQGANCVIAGTSPAVTALAYSDKTDVLSVGTSQYRSDFKGLQRINAVAGAVTSLAAGGEAIATNGTLYQPAISLRDELARKDEQLAAYGQDPVFFEYDAVTSQVAFVLPKGYKTLAVYSAGTLKRVGSTKDYQVGTDGYAETVTFAVAPGNTVWVSIMAIKG